MTGKLSQSCGLWVKCLEMIYSHVHTGMDAHFSSRLQSFVLVLKHGYRNQILVWVLVDRGQTRKICEKQEKYSKGKVGNFTVQRMVLYQYPVYLLTFLEVY